MPRFVVLTHDWPAPHFDLFLEAGSELRSWKLPADFSPTATSAIIPGAPHRPLYLDYEGAIGGGRGSVTRWDAGEFRWITDSSAQFFGEQLKGVYEWIEAPDGCWTFGPVT